MEVNLELTRFRRHLPQSGAARPNSLTAGLTLPQAVLLREPVPRCGADRCRACNQLVNLHANASTGTGNRALRGTGR